jgi:ADP-ribose pyrophosphatase YjhB (NUDIX family)
VTKRVRALGLALIRRGDEILAEEGWDGVKNERFFRLLGGEIEFGERGAETVRRELREELGADSDVSRQLGTVETVFTYEGEPGHDIALIYECSLLDDRVYSLDEWDANETTEAGLVTHKLAWKQLESFRSGREILYPGGVLSLIGDP